MTESRESKIIDELIFPHPEERIILVEARGSKDEILTGERADLSARLSKRILKELDLPYHQTLIRLNQCSRNLAGDTKGPNVLYLSATEGGFPRKGLRILGQQGKSGEVFPNLNYVDLVLNEESLKEGALHIYSHELGHVMMNNIMPSFANIPPERTSSLQHVSMGITDYFTAFFEGWGNHFQSFSTGIKKYRKSFQAQYDPKCFPKTLWHCAIDRELRVNGVIRNSYIYEKPLLPELLSPDLSLADKILLYHTYPQFNLLKLRNAQQMLSCEGVIASIFQRIMTGQGIRYNFRKPVFYDRFLLKQTEEDITKLISPYENIMLKNFHVWSILEKSQEYLQKPVFIEYLHEWCRAFPEDTEELLSIFINMTAGTTMSSETVDLYEEAAFYGIKGDAGNFSTVIKKYLLKIKDLIARASDDFSTLSVNIGPELWIENRHFKIRKYLWLAEPLTNLRINLNTASPAELAAFPGMTIEKGIEVTEIREKKGYFKSFEEARYYGMVLPKEVSD